jgi:hypothetical protein
MYRSLVAALFVFALAACAARPAAIPSNVSFGARPVLPRPVTALPDAPPKIVGAWFSSNDVPRGHTWSGEIVTTTNVASVEIRTNLFSINVPRRAFGHFAFHVRVFDVPPVFIRAYQLRIIARNAQGAKFEEDIPFRIR